jgi:hypothetical protein
MLLRRTQLDEVEALPSYSKIEGIDGRAVNFFGVGQNALLGFQPLILLRSPQVAPLQSRALEIPQVQQPHAILLILL